MQFFSETETHSRRDDLGEKRSSLKLPEQAPQHGDTRNVLSENRTLNKLPERASRHPGTSRSKFCCVILKYALYLILSDVFVNFNLILNLLLFLFRWKC